MCTVSCTCFSHFADPKNSRQLTAHSPKTDRLMVLARRNHPDLTPHADLFRNPNPNRANLRRGARLTSRPRPTKPQFHRPHVQKSRPDLQEGERREKTCPFQKQSSLLLLKTPQSQSQVDIATLPLQKRSETRSRVSRLRSKA